jgi:hypothetical protein
MVVDCSKIGKAQICQGLLGISLCFRESCLEWFVPSPTGLFKRWRSIRQATCASRCVQGAWSSGRQRSAHTSHA